MARDAQGHFIRAIPEQSEAFPVADETADETAPRDVAPDVPKAEPKAARRGPGWPKGRPRGPRQPRTTADSPTPPKLTHARIAQDWSMLFARIHASIATATGVESMKLAQEEARDVGESMATLTEILGPATMGKWVMVGQASLTIAGVETFHVLQLRNELQARQAQAAGGPRLVVPVPVAEQTTPVPGRPMPIGLAADGQPLRVDPATLGGAPIAGPVSVADVPPRSAGSVQ